MFCPNCGKETNGKFCSHCGCSTDGGKVPQQPIQQEPLNTPIQPRIAPQSNQPAKKKGKGCLISVIVAVAVVFFLVIIVMIFGTESTETGGTTSPLGSSASSSSIKEDTTRKPEVKTTENKSAYIQSCKTIAYKTIAREPEKYRGQKFKFTGEVIQVVESSYGIVKLRVNVTRNDYGYEDTILVSCYRDPDEPRILEDDIITLYGACDGLYTYESVMGASVSIPKINAKYIMVK